MEITTETGYRMIDRGLDDNIMVFDNNAGMVTKKLVFHMKYHCRTLTTLLVPPDAYVENLPDGWDLSEPTITLFNVHIYWDDRLEEHSDHDKCGKWLQYFKMRGGSIPRNNTNLIIGFDNRSDDVILGSY